MASKNDCRSRPRVSAAATKFKALLNGRIFYFKATYRTMEVGAESRLPCYPTNLLQISFELIVTSMRWQLKLNLFHSNALRANNTLAL